jgi:hypothetical protein
MCLVGSTTRHDHARWEKAMDLEFPGRAFFPGIAAPLCSPVFEQIGSDQAVGFCQITV